jgi:hypothetical protein
MWYFLVGILFGVVLHLTYQFIVSNYLQIKREVWHLRNERESHVKEIGNMLEYLEWRKHHK